MRILYSAAGKPGSGPVNALGALWRKWIGRSGLGRFRPRRSSRNDGFLLIDYPGYGLCEGSAGPENIALSADTALLKLAEYLHSSKTDLELRLNVLGHSIGCAVALEFATRHPVRKIVLLAPFTSLMDMARRQVGRPLCYLLRQHFDNRARLAELARRPEPPRIVIFHGKRDLVIPEKMGRSLAESFPKMIEFHEVPDAGHNSIIEDAGIAIYSAMNQ